MIIIIPCYNEFNRINKNSYIDFLNENKNCTIVFAEDGSTDNTLSVLKEIQDTYKTIGDHQILINETLPPGVYYLLLEGSITGKYTQKLVIGGK